MFGSRRRVPGVSHDMHGIGQMAPRRVFKVNVTMPRPLLPQQSLTQGSQGQSSWWTIRLIGWRRELDAWPG